MVMKLYYIYILENPTGKKYIGVTEDIGQRLHDHNSGISKWTKGKGPWEIIWSKECTSLSDARKMENLLKRQKGGSGLYKITGLPKPGS